jgi:hypothetical protein
LETGPHRGLETVSSFSTLEAPVVTDDLDADHEISSSSNNSSRVELSPDDILLALEKEAEERRNSAKYRALQAAFPAVAIGAGAVGALAGVDGALEMVGVTATASFISYELLWANTRDQLWEEINKITDHRKLFKFLKKRKIVQEC